MPALGCGWSYADLRALHGGFVACDDKRIPGLNPRNRVVRSPKPYENGPDRPEVSVTFEDDTVFTLTLQPFFKLEIIVALRGFDLS